MAASYALPVPQFYSRTSTVCQLQEKGKGKKGGVPKESMQILTRSIISAHALTANFSKLLVGTQTRYRRTLPSSTWYDRWEVLRAAELVPGSQTRLPYGERRAVSVDWKDARNDRTRNQRSERVGRLESCG